MKLRSFALIFVILTISAFFVHCKKKTIVEEDPETSFDKSAMLSNYSENVIIPNLSAFKISIDSLVNSFNIFIQTKNTSNLSSLRQKYQAAYIKFQYISSFEFGPSEAENLRTNFDTYPVSTSKVDANIANGSFNLGTVDKIDAKGFPAIDYLLFGTHESDSAIITKFDADPSAANRTTYLSTCLNEMQSKINTIVNQWNSGYKNTFTNSTGAQIGSSLGLMINQLNFEIDLLKNSKIGIPLGKKSLGTKLPEKCEAFYANNISVSLAKACLDNIENVYRGRSTAGNDGLGIDDYLDNIKAAHGTETLNATIKNQFAKAKTALNLVAEPLSESVVNTPGTVDAAYFEMVKLLVLLKTDTPSALGIVITYQDGDGD